MDNKNNAFALFCCNLSKIRVTVAGFNDFMTYWSLLGEFNNFYGEVELRSILNKSNAIPRNQPGVPNYVESETGDFSQSGGSSIDQPGTSAAATVQSETASSSNGLETVQGEKQSQLTMVEKELKSKAEDAKRSASTVSRDSGLSLSVIFEQGGAAENDLTSKADRPMAINFEDDNENDNLN